MIEVHAQKRRLLKRALSADKLPHAYLFAGPEGSGKRTMARELAMALLCEKGAFPPCLACGPCRRVEGGSHPDFHLVEADGKTITIKSIRELSARLNYHGFEGGARVGVVPEAERMKVETQNAFLKTLEEPPAGATLILTTNNPGRILPTIISRCQTLRFGPMPKPALVELVIEERGLDSGRAGLVAAIAHGNARKALAMDLDFVIDFRKQTLERLYELGAEDLAGLLDFADQLAKAPYPVEDTLDLIAGYYLDALHQKLGIGEINNQDLDRMIDGEARAGSVEKLLNRLESVHGARLRAAGNANQRLNWEILAMALKDVKGAEIKSR